MAYTNTATHSGLGLVARLRAALETLKAARTRRAEFYRTVRELDRLSDRELLDLGLNRWEIHQTAQRHVYGH